MLYARRTLRSPASGESVQKTLAASPVDLTAAPGHGADASLQMTSGSAPAGAEQGTVRSFLGDRRDQARNAQCVLHLGECVGTSKVPRIGTRVPWIAARASSECILSNPGIPVWKDLFTSRRPVLCAGRPGYRFGRRSARRVSRSTAFLRSASRFSNSRFPRASASRSFTRPPLL